MESCCAVLLDTIGIQKYVFASNELRDNIGASSIIKNLFTELAVPALQEACDLKTEQVKETMNRWEQKPAEILMENDPSIPFEIGVSGGGKALIFFRNSNRAREFVKIFTRDLLVKAPGLQLAVAIDDNFVHNEQFTKRLEELYKQLTVNRNQYFPVTTLATHGITAICPNTGMSLDCFTEREYMSSAGCAKRHAADREEKELQEKLNHEYTDYSFSSRVDRLGQREGDSYIAVVHADGNNMGNWFKQSKNLIDYRQRSLNLVKITETCFWELVYDLVKEPYFREKGSGFSLKTDNQGRTIIPLRPIILGGDDFTFVCEGKLGIYLAEQFIKKWAARATSQLSAFGMPDSGQFSACAGIAIAKTKYPFYRAYEYAEQLCSNAKKCARKEPKGSWIDFHIIAGNRSGDIHMIRDEDRQSRGLQLYFGPYYIESAYEDKKTPQSLQHLKAGIAGFLEEDRNWSRSRIKELRTAFYLGKEAVNTFLTDMKAKGVTLPNRGVTLYEKDYSEKGIIDGCTPYYDMLEILEYYPEFLLKEGE